MLLELCPKPLQFLLVLLAFTRREGGSTRRLRALVLLRWRSVCSLRRSGLVRGRLPSNELVADLTDLTYDPGFLLPAGLEDFQLSLSLQFLLPKVLETLLVVDTRGVLTGASFRSSATAPRATG